MSIDEWLETIFSGAAVGLFLFAVFYGIPVLL